MLSIVVPVYNGEKTIESLYKETEKAMQQKNYNFEMIFVDDASKDNSVEVIRRLCQIYEFSRGILLENNVGQQNASLAGIRFIKGDIAVTIDDDLQNHPKDIFKLVEMLEKGYDVAYGVPRKAKHNFCRRVGTMLKESLFFLTMGKPFEIRLTSFRAMNKKVVDYIKRDKLHHVYISARTLQYTKNICNVTVRHYGRHSGDSNYTLKKLSTLLLKTVFNYCKLPIIKRFRKKGKQYVIKELL